MAAGGSIPVLTTLLWHERVLRGLRGRSLTAKATVATAEQFVHPRLTEVFHARGILARPRRPAPARTAFSWPVQRWHASCSWDASNTGERRQVHHRPTRESSNEISRLCFGLCCCLCLSGGPDRGPFRRQCRRRSAGEHQ